LEAKISWFNFQHVP